jgi:hypothetical protein
MSVSTALRITTCASPRATRLRPLSTETFTRSWNGEDTIRRQQFAEINAQPGSREALEAEHGQVWDTSQLSQDFTVEGFAAPYVVVRRKSDGQRGTLMFQHNPRYYFAFEPHRE